MIKAVIWDMDGVLVDSETHYDVAMLAVLHEFGVPAKGDFLRSTMGMNQRSFLATVNEEFGMNLGENFLERLNEEVAHYYADVFPLVPHVKEVLKELDGKVKMGLATSSSRRHAEAVLTRHGIWQFLEAQTCGDDVVDSKPNPEIFLKTAEKLGVAAENCLVVEDSERGMAGAKAAGMRLVARKAGHNRHANFSVADGVAEDLLEVIKFIF